MSDLEAGGPQTNQECPPLTLSMSLPADQLGLLAAHVAAYLEQHQDQALIDAEAAAAFLGGCSRKAVYHLVERGRIRSHRVGGRLLFDPVELRADVERGE
jgi:excisionase family DNA binding protein